MDQFLIKLKWWLSVLALLLNGWPLATGIFSWLQHHHQSMGKRVSSRQRPMAVAPTSAGKRLWNKTAAITK
jgi:hypothetical protein